VNGAQLSSDTERLRNHRSHSRVVWFVGESGHVGIDPVVDIGSEAFVAVGISGS
jgi:hypothetical protein